MEMKTDQQENSYSQFRAMFAITRASLRSILRSPSAVVFTLLFPLIFILVFGFIQGGDIRLRVGLDPTGETDNPLFEKLSASRGLTLMPDESVESLHTALKKGEIDGIVRIKRNGGPMEQSTYSLELTTAVTGGESAVIVRSMLEHLVDKANLEAMGPRRDLARLEQKVVQSREYKTIDFILPGQLGFSLLSSGVFGTAFVFFNLRQTLVVKRFFATPIRKPFIVLGEAISRMVFSLLGAAFLITVGHFAFGFTLVHGWITFLSMLGLSALGLIVFMGFGFLVSGLANSESTIPPLANVITLPQFLLSGTFFSIQNFPEWLQPVCKILPLTYLNEAMRLVAYEGAGWDKLWMPIGIVVLSGIVVYALAVRFFRWE